MSLPALTFPSAHKMLHLLSLDRLHTLLYSEKRGYSQYAPLALHDELRSADHPASLLEASGDRPTFASSKSSKLLIYLSSALALLSAINVALLSTTLSRYQAHPFSDYELATLPYGDNRLGLDLAAKAIPHSQVYHHAWPDRIARVSRKLKKAVWGHGVQFYVTVEVRTPCSVPTASSHPLTNH